MPKLRVVNWNLNGAVAATNVQQRRAWHLIAAWDTDLVLLQEVRTSGIPKWAREEWKLVLAEDRKWGSVVGARPDLKLEALDPASADPWVGIAYNYLVIGKITLPDSSSCFVGSVHTPAKELPDFLDWQGHKNALSAAEIDSLRRPLYGGIPYANDFILGGLERATRGMQFLIGGDWNTSRSMDNDSSEPGCWSFFNRARQAGWHDCHSHKNEERTFLKDGTRPYQLDHIFCDQTTAENLVDCSVRADPVVHELSDHAPMVTEFEF